jgi:multidrug efflux pump subunit AcrA (membrane-fusion protein)
MGTVIPAREIILESRVTGVIVALHPEFTVGGFLDKGSEVLRIDSEDYQLAVTLAQAKIKDSESVLKVVQEEAAASEEEWRLLYKANPQGYKMPALVAKKPQLEAAKSKLAADRADLQKAKLDLARTRIRAPFNAFVRTKQVDMDIGSQVSSQEQLAELVGTDTYWIRASIPIDRLSWILIPGNPAESGSRVRISHRNGHELAGTVIKLLGDLETEGRMARILVEVKDPLGLKAKEKYQLPLLIGEYIRIEIEGRELQNAYRIPRSALRDDSNIWIASDEDRLEIRRVGGGSRTGQPLDCLRSSCRGQWHAGENRRISPCVHFSEFDRYRSTQSVIDANENEIRQRYLSRSDRLDGRPFCGRQPSHGGFFGWRADFSEPD